MHRAPSIGGTPSIYSHTTSRSTALRSSKSVKSLHIPWYKRPMVASVFGFGIQQLSLVTSIYSIILSLFTMGTSAFDIYCFDEATPGSTHYGYYIISFDFVYVGNRHVRNALITIAVFSMFGGLALFVTSIMLLNALRQEYERKMIPWLVCMLVFAVWRAFSLIFCAVVNDMIFAYNIIMCLFWIVFTVCNFVGWAAVYSLFLELSDLTKLEDLAHLREPCLIEMDLMKFQMGTLTSLATHSMAGSRPTTPHSTASTFPLP